MIREAMIKFDKLLGETPKAYLIKFLNEQHWIPKSKCKNFTTNQKLGGHVTLPAWIINRMLDTDINQSQEYHNHITPTWVVEHHVPERIEPKAKQADENLTR